MSASPYWQLSVPVSPETAEGLTNFAWELGAVGVVEETDLQAFFPPDSDPAALRTRMREYLDGLRALGFAAGRIATVAPIHGERWAEAWKAHFRPLEIGERFLIAPPWDTPASRRLTLVIEPGRAFGTGHHGSTAGCLVLLERALASPASLVVDIGTGSGILGIAAARLGAADVLAIDDDPDAIAAATANAQRNGLTPLIRCVLMSADALPHEQRAPLVLANLLGPAHRRLASRYAELVSRGGTLIVGGILDSEAQSVLDTLGRAGFGVVDRELRDEWVTFALHPV